VGADPAAVAYDSVKGELFVANSNSGNVSVISDLSNTVVATVAVGAFPEGVAYDSGKGEIFVADEGSDKLTVISDSSNTVVATVAVGTSPASLAYDSGKGEVFVTNSNDVSVVSDSSNTVVALVTVGQTPDGLTYDSGNGEVYVANEVSNNVSVISDENDRVVATVAVGVSPEGIAYDSGMGEVFVTNSGSGTVSILSFGSMSVAYPVTFTESGLPGGTTWWVNASRNLSSSSSATVLSFNAPNGTYTYTVAAADKSFTASGGSFTVSGASVSEPVSFSLSSSAVAFTVMFMETGLPAGANWSVTMAGATKSSTGDIVTFEEPNGTFSYTIGKVVGYRPTQVAGSITVAGVAVEERITFYSGTPSPSTALGLPETEGYAVLGGIIAAMAVAVGVLVLHRRRRAGSLPAPPASPPTPEAGQPPATP
jgi:YVTN family beta-propeller protein